MESNLKTQLFKIIGMTCINCQYKIERKLIKTEGIKKVNVSYRSGTVELIHDESIIPTKEIIRIIEDLDYKVATTNSEDRDSFDITKLLSTVVIIFALYTIMRHIGITNIFNKFPQVQENMGYSMLFFIGILTSVHCIAMCGGINLSQCISISSNISIKQNKFETVRPSILYNLGRVISYTIIGGIVGSIGSVVSFSGSLKGIIQIIAGIFMVIMGLNMLNIFPWLRRLVPRVPRVITDKIKFKKQSNSPFFVGLLNGLMPCGPLQSMQLYALSTASPVQGAFSMLIFSLGTVPLMFGFGALSSIFSGKFTRKVMTAGAALVVILGLSMLNNGLSLSGFNTYLGISNSESSSEAKIEDDVQIINTSLYSSRYEPITVQAGIPVKWTITAKNSDINGCNNRIIIPEYSIEKKLEEGDNIIEFTPTKTGTFPYSCWMGMIRSSITVTEDDGGSTSSDSSKTEGLIGNEIEIPVSYTIPTDKVEIAEIIEGIQYVKINMEEERFSPAIIILQKGVETKLIIKAKDIYEGDSSLLFPYFNAQLTLTEGENSVSLVTEEDFVFSDANNTFYAYVKVVDDLNKFDIEAIKEEVSNYKTTKWYYSGSGASCH